MSRYVDEHRGRFGVEPICSVLDVSASAYYQRATGERSARDIEDERLLAVIRVVHEKNYEAYGYRRTWKALLRKGETGPRCQVQRLMHDNAIVGAKRRGRPWRTTIPDACAGRPADLVERDFSAGRPNELWVCENVAHVFAAPGTVDLVCSLPSGGGSASFATVSGIQVANLARADG